MITSGDWKYDPAWAVVETSDGISICDLGPRNDANGYLLAAAPDLLDACEHLLSLFKSFNFGGDWEQSNYPAVKEAGTAIAKARGQNA